MIAADADAALRIFAAAPLGCGLVLKGAPCPARDAILAAFAAATPPPRRLPLHIGTERLTGGIDIAASLATGRQVAAPGILDGAPAILVLSMAERWDRARLSPIARSLDAARCAVIALDESTADETPAPALTDRCAFHLDLSALPEDYRPPSLVLAPGASPAPPSEEPADSQDEILIALCTAAEALGTPTLRAPLFALRCAQTAARLAGRAAPTAEDAALAARLVLSPRATRLPPAEPQAETPEPESSPTDTDRSDPADQRDTLAGQTLADRVIDAARVALPADLLDIAQRDRRAARTPGRQGDAGLGASHGRPIGARQGVPGKGLRLDITGTLRAAVPWQSLRGRTATDRRLRITRADLHIQRCKPRTATTTIFAVDASGSQALARMAEAKGAVELLLADCYIRRDSVALIAFRGATAEILLPPTRAPARARRCLAGLAGGGGTPLAAGLLAATALADAASRRGETPTIVLLTDGQANIARDGTPGRVGAQQDALSAARALKQHGCRALLIDTANRRQDLARGLADAMGGRYLPLPRLDAVAVSKAVRAAQA